MKITNDIDFEKVVKMLITIVILFAVCWLPIHIYNIIVWFFPPKFTTDTVYNVYVFSYFCCHFLSMSHSFINPFVYGFMSENFKVLVIKSIFCRDGSLTIDVIYMK